MSGNCSGSGSKKVILSGIRPTGKLHLGHWAGALSNWVNLQNEYECFFMVADWHALMGEYKNAHKLPEYILDNVADWISWGIDPEKSVIFVQSQVKEHLELFMFFSALTPLGWLFRCPTFKEQIAQLKDKEINTYSFLGYPVLQAADILIYKANHVPVGEDQLPHLELTREIVRRFHFLYNCEIFPEPQALLTSAPRLMGLDGRKMSKSYGNYIALDESKSSLEKKVLNMFTDPSRLRRSDPGHPEVCNVFNYYSAFFPEIKEEVVDWCTNAKRGCKECKKILAEKIDNFIAKPRENKNKLISRKHQIEKILQKGVKKASQVAAQTIKEVKKAVFG